MWSRQLSTFERSSMTGSMICVVVSLMGAQPGSCSLRRTLQGFVRAIPVKGLLGAADGCGRGESPQEFLQSRLEDAPLGLHIGAQLVDPAAHLRLELPEPQVL